jgi:hypothetical protein
MELYDAEDDEACHQAAANAALWLKERSTRIKDAVDAVDGTSYNGVGSDSWQDTPITTVLDDQVAGDIVTALVNFEAMAGGDNAGQSVSFRVKIDDGDGVSYSRESLMSAPEVDVIFVAFCLIAQRVLTASANVTITLQVKNSNVGVDTIVAAGTILPSVERRKADDI